MKFQRIRCASALIVALTTAVSLSAATYHVSLSGTPAAPYDTWGNAANSIHDAMALAGAGDTVLVDSGVYAVTQEIVLNADTVVRGQGAGATTLERVVAAGTFRILNLNHAGARAESLTVKGGVAPAGNYSASGVHLQAGTLSACVVTAGSGGIALYALGAGAVVTDCTISGNANYAYAVRVNSGGLIRDSTISGNSAVETGGLVLYGTAERCRILNNASNGGYGPAGVTVAGGTLRNCLVAGNAHNRTQSAGGVRLNSGTIENCTITNNANHADSARGSGVDRTGGTIANSIIYGNTGSNGVNYVGAVSAVSNSCAPELTAGVQGNITADPLFVDAGGGDYHLQGLSQGIDSGAALAGVTDDLDGTARPIDGNADGTATHDMGAYEMPVASGALQVTFSASPTAGLDPVSCTLSGHLAGANQTIVEWRWDYDNDGSFDDFAAGLDTAVHVYGAGIHTARVQVENAIGETATYTGVDFLSVVGTDLYVDNTSTTPLFPYDTPAKAATNVHDATDIAVAGCTVHIADGVYPTTKEIVLSGDIAILGNGPENSTLQRNTAAGTFRLLTLDHANALVDGLSLVDGASPAGNYSAAGVRLVAGTLSDCEVNTCSGGVALYMESANAQVDGCVVSYNSSYAYAVRVNGGGVISDSTINNNSAVETGGLLLYGAAARCRILDNASNGGYGPAGVTVNGTLRNCLVAGNSHNRTQSAGGVRLNSGTIENCTITDNTNHADSVRGAGVDRAGGTVVNSIIYGNTGSSGVDYVGDIAAVSYSCAPQLSAGVNGNVNTDPLFTDPGTEDYHLQAVSPCLDAGTALASVTDDLDGAVRPQDGNNSATAEHDMGAYEMPPFGGPLEVVFSGSPSAGLNTVACELTATLSGANQTIVLWQWDFDNDGTYDLEGSGDLSVVSRSYGIGRHSAKLRVTNSSSEVAVATNLDFVSVVGPDLYVDETSTSPEFPYNTPAKAATDVHDATDAAVAGCTVHIADGTYPTTKEIILDADVSVVGNGATATVLTRDAGASVFRMFSLTHADAAVSSLTLRNGASPAGNYSAAGVRILAGTLTDCILTACNGGIALTMDGSSSRASGCVISNCPAYATAVHVSNSGVIEDCTITGNSAVETGGLRVYSGSTADRCRVVDNTVHGAYGPAGVTVSGGTLRNSLVAGNSHTRTQSAGGAFINGGLIENCTITGNSNAAGSAAGAGLQRTGGTVRNTIVYGNTGSGGVNYVGDPSGAEHSCAPELTSGTGNITANPLFVDAGTGDFHLSEGSPCIDTGLYQSWMDAATDLDGTPRLGSPVDIGAFEFHVVCLPCENFATAVYAALCGLGAGAPTNYAALIEFAAGVVATAAAGEDICPEDPGAGSYADCASYLMGLTP